MVNPINSIIRRYKRYKLEISIEKFKASIGETKNRSNVLNLSGGGVYGASMIFNIIVSNMSKRKSRKTLRKIMKSYIKETSWDSCIGLSSGALPIPGQFTEEN